MQKSSMCGRNCWNSQNSSKKAPSSIPWSTHYHANIKLPLNNRSNKLSGKFENSSYISTTKKAWNSSRKNSIRPRVMITSAKWQVVFASALEIAARQCCWLQFNIQARWILQLTRWIRLELPCIRSIMMWEMVVRRSRRRRTWRAPMWESSVVRWQWCGKITTRSRLRRLFLLLTPRICVKFHVLVSLDWVWDYF